MSIRQTGTTQFHQEQYQIKLGARNFAISTKMILIAILFLSITLRLLSAVYQGNNVSDLPGVYDQISYDGLARRVVDGFGFSFAEGHWPATPAGEPTAHWSYLYTLYLALIYKLFGPYPLIARVIQALIAGIFQTLLIVRIGSRLFNRTVGLIAAALNAAYIYFFYYAGALMTETFYITCILWTFDVSFRLVYMDRNTHKVGQTRSRLQWLELGLAIGLRAIERLQALAEQHSSLFDKKHPVQSRIESLMRYATLIEKIEMFWLDPTNREPDSWTAHRDINMVMLATSLAPMGYLL